MFGAFSAAIEVRGPRWPSSSRADARTASIAPDGISCMRRARCASKASASSRLNVPPTHAATYSPTLWPIIALGLTPQEIHNCASAYSMANSAGCVIAVCVSCACARAASSAFG